MPITEQGIREFITEKTMGFVFDGSQILDGVSPEERKMQLQRQACLFYGYGDAGGRDESRVAAQRLVSHLHQEKLVPPTVRHVTVSPCLSAALEDLHSVLVGPSCNVTGLMKENSVHNLGNNIRFIRLIRVDAHSPLSLDEMVEDANDDTLFVEYCVHDSPDYPYLGTRLSDTKEYQGRVVCVDAFADSKFPAVVSGPKEVMERMTSAQMKETAGLSVFDELVIQYIAQQCEDMPEEKTELDSFADGVRYSELYDVLAQVPIREILGKYFSLKAELEQSGSDKQMGPNGSIGMPYSYSIPDAVARHFLKNIDTIGCKLEENVAQVANARYMSQRYGPGHVHVTHGANGGLIATLKALATKGEPLVLLAPHFSSYKAIALQAGYSCDRIIQVEADADTLLPNFEKLRDQMRSHPSATVIVNDPNNPTGLKWPSEQVVQFETIMGYAKGSTTISDDVYHSLVHSGDEVRRVNIPGQVLIMSMAKEFGGAPAARGGAVLTTNQELLKEIGECATLRGPLNHYSRALFSSALSCYVEEIPEVMGHDEARRLQYKRNIEAMVESANRFGDNLRVIGEPNAGFYAIIGLPREIIGHDPLQAVLELMEQHQSGSMVPLESFGLKGDDAFLYFRISLGDNEQHAAQLIESIGNAVCAYKKVQTHAGEAFASAEFSEGHEEAVARG